MRNDFGSVRMIARNAGESGNDLKLKFKALLKEAGGSRKASQFCRVEHSVLSGYASTSTADAERFPPIDVVRDVEALAQAPIVTEYLAVCAGGVFVEVPEVVAGGVDLLQLLAAQSKESSDLTAAICSALADGKIDSSEGHKAIEEIDQLVRVAMQMRAELALIVGEGR